MYYFILFYIRRAILTQTNPKKGPIEKKAHQIWKVANRFINSVKKPLNLHYIQSTWVQLFSDCLNTIGRDRVNNAVVQSQWRPPVNRQKDQTLILAVRKALPLLCLTSLAQVLGILDHTALVHPLRYAVHHKNQVSDLLLAVKSLAAVDIKQIVLGLGEAGLEFEAALDLHAVHLVAEFGEAKVDFLQYAHFALFPADFVFGIPCDDTLFYIDRF